jgi:MerR family transcriptional regulator, copper efflux regulator
MRIGDVAREANVPSTTIRYYEDIGLLPRPARARNGYRDYGRDAVERLRFVRDAQDSGLTLEEITSIVELRNQGRPTCNHVVSLLQHHLEDVERRIETLKASRDLYARLIARASTLDPADCTDPSRCQTISTHAQEAAER